MTYGLQFINNSGELTLSSEAFTFNYLGKATFVSSTDVITSGVNSSQGNAKWTFNATGPIIVALGLRSSNQTGISLDYLEVPSAGVWNIYVKDLSTTAATVNAAYKQVRTDTDVYVFGLPVAASLPPYGVALYNSAGLLTADLSKRVLSPAANITIAANTPSTSIPSLTKPAVIGYTRYSDTSYTTDGFDGDGAQEYKNTYNDGYWHWDGSTTLSRVLQLDAVQRKQPSPETTGLRYFATKPLIIEANGLT